MTKKTYSLVLLLVSVLILPISGGTLSNKKNELNNTKQSIKQSKEKLEQASEQKAKVTQQLRDIDANMIKVEDELLEVEKDLDVKEKQIDKTQSDLKAAIKKKDLQYEATKKRMVHMYKNRKVGYLELVFSSNNFWEMLNRVQYIKIISAHDKDLLIDYENQKKLVEDKKVILEEEKTAIEKLYNKKMARKDELDGMRDNKNSLLGEIKQEQKVLHAKIEEMQQISNELEAQIKKLMEKPAIKTMRYTGGAFLWPVPGYYGISSEYNPRVSPISGRNEFHTGIDIPASYGEAVVAAADGVVINSGWVNGYGNTIMISHGSGLVTLYGHNSSLTVSEGQHVTRGQTIARIGSTGWSTGNHCHFEVRVNGSHTSPWAYLNQ